MAFAVAANYGNLPNGVFSPTIFSMKAQLAFRKKAVALGITNNDYFGEIANKGDTVRILKEPEIVVNPLVRGTQIVPQDLEDDDFQLTIDQAQESRRQAPPVIRCQVLRVRLLVRLEVSVVGLRAARARVLLVHRIPVLPDIWARVVEPPQVMVPVSVVHNPV